MELSRNPIKFMWFILKKSRKWAIIAVLAVILAELLHGALLLALRELTDAVTNAVEYDFSDEALKTLWLWLIVYPIGFFMTENAWRVSGFAGMRLVTQSEANTTRELFRYLIEHSRTYFNSKFAGSIVNKIGHASRGLDDIFANILWSYLPLVIGLTVDLIIVSSINYKLGIMLFIWTAIFMGTNYILVKRKQYLSYASANANSELKGKMVDTISNIASVHANAYHEYERKFVGEYIEKYRKSGLRSWMASEWILFINGGLLAIFAFGMMWITILAMKNSQASIGSLVLVISMMIDLMRSLFFIGHKMTDTIDHYSQIEEGLNELITPYEVTDRPGAKSIRKAKGSISFENVHFSFDNQKVFNDFSLNIESGQKVGIVGVSGAGKTTLVNLLLRNHDIKNGCIKLDGHELMEITRKSLRRQISVVPQDVSLFHRSILENIRYGNLKATDKEIIEASKRAQAHKFIIALPKGYDTYVGERGVKLSGGQRQRIAIARAFLKNAPILLLDEATSALDSESEVLVQSGLVQLMHGKTVLAIAHRLSTLRVMDRIVVLEKGHIIEDGTHDSLLRKKGIYANLWNHQIEGFIE